MRNDFKKYSWTLWLVILAFIGGFVVTDAFRGDSRVESGLIFINGEPVIQGDEYQQQLLNTLNRYKEQLKENFNKSLITQWGLPEQILREMITNSIITMEAKELDISVSTGELQDKIISFPAFQQDGKFIGARKYKQILGYQKVSVSEFEEQLKQQILGEKLQELVAGSLVLNHDLLQDQYKKEKDQAELDYITFTPKRINSEINVTEKELTQYYDNNKEEFKSREKRSANVIALKFADYQKEVNITPQEIYDYFRNNKDEFRLPGKTKVSRIFLKYSDTDREETYKKVVALHKELNTENFAEIAKTHSQDDKAAQGGDYGYTGWKNFTHQEITIIDSLEQNQISTPIDTQKGFSIVYIPEKVAERQQSFNEVKDKIEETIRQERVKKYVTEKLQKIYVNLKNADNFKQKAKELGYNVVETQLLTSGQAVKDIDELGYISRKMFTLEEKEIDFPVQFAQGIAIVQLSKIEEPVIEPFEKVKDQVKEQILVTKKIKLLKEDAAEISKRLNQMNDEKKIEDFLKKEDLSATNITYKRGNKLAGFPAVDGLDDQIFSMKENQYSSPLSSDNRVIIFKVKSKTITSNADFEKNEEEYYSKQLAQLKNTYFRSYINQKMQDYKVSQNQKLFDQIKDWALARIN